MDHHARVRINRSSMLPEATVALYPRLSFWGQHTDAAGETSWVSPSVSFTMGKTGHYFVECAHESLERELLPFTLSIVSGVHPACSDHANSMVMFERCVSNAELTSAEPERNREFATCSSWTVRFQILPSARMSCKAPSLGGGLAMTAI